MTNGIDRNFCLGGYSAGLGIGSPLVGSRGEAKARVENLTFIDVRVVDTTFVMLVICCLACINDGFVKP